MSDSDPNRDSVTEVAEESFVRERPLEIERGAVLAGRYQVEEVIGKGGSGVVLRVFDRTVQNVVALKVLKSELARDTKWDKRFSRELRLGRPIQHPNVCRIFDIGEADGHRFLTMELATGGSLRDELKRRPALDRPIEDRLKDARAAIEGLAAIHATGVVHRDFKPDNLLRMEDGRLVISDFGLATDAAAAPGVTVMIGTPHYMAPEVLAGEPATSRSDVWALGVAVHEILFGRRPERKTTSFEGREKTGSRPPSKIERAMLALCERCTSETPADRPTDAGQVARLLYSAETGRLKRHARIRLWPGLLSVAVLAAIGVGYRLVRDRTTHGDIPAIPVLSVANIASQDWSNRTIVVELPGHVDCLTVLNDSTIEVVWGRPARAETIEWPSGRRAPSSLLSVTYQLGCPERSADGRRVLYTGQTAAGGREIRLSENPAGANAIPIASGSNPVWLNDEDFVYDIDASHSAVFSLTTMTFALLASKGVDDTYGVADKTASLGKVAVLYGRGPSRLLAVFDARTLAEDSLVAADKISAIRFELGTTELLAAREAGANDALVGLDWRINRALPLAHYADFDLVSVYKTGGKRVALAIRKMRDAWVVDQGGPRRVTTDGKTYSVSARASNEMLLGRRDESGAGNIWYRSAAGREMQVTTGRVNVAPAFDGRSSAWAYADYGREAIVVCEDFEPNNCHLLYRDDSLPTAPAFSVDGTLISAMTQRRTPKVLIFARRSGQVTASWDLVPSCPPVWSADGTIWSTEAGADGLSWTEHRPDGRKTGRRIKSSPSDNSSTERCWPEGIPGSPGLRRSWIVKSETARVLDVDDGPLHAP